MILSEVAQVLSTELGRHFDFTAYEDLRWPHKGSCTVAQVLQI